MTRQYLCVTFDAQLDTAFIISRPDQNAIKALFVGCVRVGQKKRIGCCVVGDEH
jgi:hypothetical protein